MIKMLLRVNMNRNRLHYIFIILGTIAIGLLSRTRFVPEFIYPYAGDYLYAVMFYFIVALMFKRKEPLKVAIISILACYAIEFFQLYQADWINAVRNTRAGALTLGSGFLWSDILSYTLGGMTAFALESAVCAKLKRGKFKRKVIN